MNISDIKKLLKDEPGAFARWEEKRFSIEEWLYGALANSGDPNVFPLWQQNVDAILRRLVESGMDWNGAEPAHAAGHVIRDYINTIQFVRYADESSFVKMVGGIAGVFHDIGTNLVPRYEEKKRVIRHAEATAIAIGELCHDILESDNIHILDIVQYAVGAHTHYLSDQKVMCADEVERTIRKYVDTDVAGNPHIMIFLPRWIDRLENCGPTHFARHYLTLVEEHHDFDGQKFHQVGFSDQMRPLLRNKAEMGADPLGRTLLEHVRMYAESQNNTTAYGKYDRGFYLYLRNAGRQRAFRIIGSAKSPQVSADRVALISEIWHQDFLAHTIERSETGQAAADVLYKNFETLDPSVQRFWATIMVQVMREYIGWHETVDDFFKDIHEAYRILRPFEALQIEPDVVKYTEPSASVRKICE